jgi:hypothetical protein
MEEGVPVSPGLGRNVRVMPGEKTRY